MNDIHTVGAISLLIWLTGVSAMFSLDQQEPKIDFQQMEVNDQQCWPFIIGIDRDNQISSHNPQQTTYLKNLHCVRIITAPLGYRVRVEFDDEYDIGEITREDGDRSKQRCENDYLLFQDGPFAFSPHIITICGLSRGQPIRSSSGYMRILFRTDDYYEKTGFNMTIYYELIEACYFYVPLLEQTSFQVSMTEAALSTGPSKPGVDCVWDIHTNRPDEWIWISINSIANQIQLPDMSARLVEIYPADEYFRVDEENSLKKPFLLDTKLKVAACRVLIHICTSKLQFTPTFTVNATGYKQPDVHTGVCSANRYLCGPKPLDQLCIPRKLLCNGYENCNEASDEDTDMCERISQSKNQKYGGVAMGMEVILVLVSIGLLFVMVVVFSMVYVVRHIKRKQHRARNADNTAIWSSNGGAGKLSAKDDTTRANETLSTNAGIE